MISTLLRSKFIFLGIIVGVVSVIYPGAIWFALFLIPVIFLFNIIKDDTKRKLYLKIFLIALIVRFVFSIGVHSFLMYTDMEGTGRGGLFQDDGANPGLGYEVCLSLLGKAEISPDDVTFVNLLHYIHAFIYLFLGGMFPLIPKLLNIVLFCVAIVFIIDVVNKCYGRRASCMAGLILAFWPSLILWPSLNLKEAGIIFFIVVSFWSAVRIKEKKIVWGLAILFVSLWALKQLRIYVDSIVLASIIIWLVALFYVFMFKRFKNILFLMNSLLLFGLVLTMIIKWDLICLMGDKFMSFIFSSSRGYVLSGGSVYKIFPDVYYLSNVSEVKFLEIKNIAPFVYIKALLHLFFEPFFWSIDNMKQLIIYPQMLVFAFLCPFILLGVIHAITKVKLKLWLFIIFVFLYANALGLTSGNVGTVIRHRDIAMPFLLPFAAIGLELVFSRNLVKKPQVF